MLKRYILIFSVLLVGISAARLTLAENQMWGNDVLVHQANHIYGFGMDQADKDTLLLVVTDSSTTGLRDTLWVYRSTNDGQTWSNVARLLSSADDVRMGKSDIIAAKGDSNFVFVFFIYYGKLYYNRYDYNTVSGYNIGTVSNDNVVDFSVCQDLWSNYWLYVVYQTVDDSVVFASSRDYGKSWAFRKNLTAITPITSKPTIAFSRGTYLVVAGKTDDDKIYTIRNDNSGNLANWKDAQYPSGLGDCDAPVLAASHTAPDSEAVFWLFHERYIGAPPLNWIINFQWSTNAGASWFGLSTPNDTSSYNRVYPSVHVLKENDASDITFAYRYEGTSPRQVRYIYKQNGQGNPSVWNASYSGINEYSPDFRPPQKAYTIRGTDNSIRSAVLYVHATNGDLYFDASAFTGVEDELEDQVVSRFSLGQNYPNPFNPSTEIEFDIPRSGPVSLEIFNILGQKVRQLLADRLERGHHTITWDGRNDQGELLANGVYFYRITVGDFSDARKMILLK
jgi:hypothetical protein